MAKRVTKVQVQEAWEKKGVPEVGTFQSQDDLKHFYKHLTNAQLDEWLEVEGLTDSIKATDSEQILRMRKCMAILYLHFPKQTAPKKESPYKKYSLEELVQLANDNNVAVDVCDDERILRMRTIMALRAAKIVE